ncbi:MAG: hypothetical protein RL215_2646, partial [Planctomycetota bacterium]
EKSRPTDPPPSETSTTHPAPAEGLRLTDRAAEFGFNFQYQNGARGQALMVESIGGGAGWLDFDRDTLPDALLAQGGDPIAPDESRPLDSLLRQFPPGRFTAVEHTAGLSDRQYSQGIATADFDNDGFEDALVTNFGTNVLYHNCGDGTFQQLTTAFEGMEPRWSSSAAWADLDRDGCLDLYICNYLRYDVHNPAPCFRDGKPALCHPRQLEPWPDECWRNTGDGHFQRVTDAWGLTGPGNKALGVAILDLTGDSEPDIYVANDTTANFLFVRNPADGRFTDEALRRGAAVSGTGDPQASMGVAAADYDQNGFPDLLLTHFSGESNTLYRNDGNAGMLDVSAATGMRELSFPKLAFGVVMHDFNQDSRMDCLIANGHIDELTTEFDGYRQQPQLLSYDGKRWNDCRDTNTWFTKKLVGRGIAIGDLEGDGDTDAIVVNQNSPATLLVNESRRGNWLQLRFCGVRSNRQGIGCIVSLRQGTKTFRAELAGGTSFASSHQPVLNFGLGEDSSPSDVEILWPSGCVQSVRAVLPGQSLHLREPSENN